MENLFQLFYASSGVCTDTRKIKVNSLFVALKGTNFNGNAFAKEAIIQGAKFAIVDEEGFSDNQSIFYVPDALKFLQSLANFHRRKFNIPLIGVTGSNGKTTTKELINCVLSRKYKTLCTTGNLNNHIGVPLTLLDLNENHEIAIIEMGANKPGDIKELVEIAEPDFGIITNIGKAHLQGFIDLNGVIKTKSELFDFIKTLNTGAVFYNADDSIIAGLCQGFSKKHNYGTSSESAVKGELLELNPYVRFKWSVNNYESEIIQTNLVGSYNFYNFLAAISIGNYFGVPKTEINSAIQAYTPTNNRSQVVKTEKNSLIVDCYNANPSSMISALQSFIENTQVNKLAILGDMLELGNESIHEHQKVIDCCIQNDLNFVTIGKIFKELNPAGYESVSQLQNEINSNPLVNYSILLKGSRGIALEKLIDIL